MALKFALLVCGVYGARLSRNETELERVAEEADALAKPLLKKKKQGEPCTCGHEEHQDCCEAGLLCTSDSEDEPYSCKVALGEDCKKDSDCAGKYYDRKVACKGNNPSPRCCIPGTSLWSMFDYKKVQLHKPWGDTARYCCFPQLDVQVSPDEEEDGTVVCM